MAGPILRSSDFRSIVAPILNEAFDGIYNQRKDEYKQVFKEEDGIQRAYQEEPVLYGFQAAPALPDGQAVSYDQGGQLYVKRYAYTVYGLAFALTKVLVEDGDHIRMGTTFSKHLAQSMTETLEILGANVMNYGFTDSAAYHGGDGKPLFSASHPVVQGTQSNLLTAAVLSQTSLEQALTTIRSAKDSRGKNITLIPKRLVVAPANMLQAEVLLNSVLRAGGANNDLNPVKSMGTLGESVVMSRLTSSTAWFVQNDVQNGLKFVWRRRIEKAMEGDFETDSVRYKSTMRLAQGWTDWRDMYGNAAA